MNAFRWVAVLLLGLGLVAALGAAAMAAPAEHEEETEAPKTSDNVAMVLAAAVAFVTAVSIVGSAMAVGKIGSAALGAAAEKPELLLRSLPLVGLAEGLAVIGFIVAILLLAKF